MLVVEKLPWGNTLEVTEGRREGHRRHAPRAARHRDRHDDLPARELRRGGDRPPHLVAGARSPPRRARARRSSSSTGGPRSISVITMPLSLVATIFVLHARGATINTMVLAGLVIALGAIVDDAIVDVENIVRRLRLARDAGSTQSTALDHPRRRRSRCAAPSSTRRSSRRSRCSRSSSSRASPARSSSRSPSPTRSRCWCRCVVAMISTPALSLILFSRGKVRAPRVAGDGLDAAGYERMLRPIVRRPVPGVRGRRRARCSPGSCVVPRLGQSLFPEFKERDFLMHWITKPGTSLPEERRIVIAGQQGAAQRSPGVRNFGSHIGQALLGEEIAGVDFGENWISIDPGGRLREDAGRDRGGRGRLSRDVHQRRDLPRRADQRGDQRRERADRRAHPRPRPQGAARARRKRSRRCSAESTASRRVNVSLQSRGPQIEVDVDLAKAKALGIKPGDVRRAAATIMSGEEVGDIFRDGKTYDVQVWSTPESRNSVDDIRNILVDTPERGAGAAGRRGDRDAATDSELHPARGQRASPRRRRRGRGPGPRRGRERRRGRPEEDQVPARAPRAGDRRVRRAAGRVSDACSATRSSRRSGSSSSCCRCSSGSASPSSRSSRSRSP